MPRQGYRECAVCGDPFEYTIRPGRPPSLCSKRECWRTRQTALDRRSRARLTAADPEHLRRQYRESYWRSHPRRGPEPGTAYADCKRCGRAFLYVISAGRHQLYCGGECSGEAERERRAEWRQANRARTREWAQANPSRVRDGFLRRKYGISTAEYDAMLAEQGGGCAICGADETSDGRRFHHVDHDHVTGAVRGILCARCNLAIGKFEDNPQFLRAAAEYLERN